MQKFIYLFLLICAIITSTFTIANDSIDRIIENKISSGLTNLGNKLSDIITGEGDTEISVSD